MFFQKKPTYDSLRQSLEAMTNHANKHKVTQFSMPKVGCGLDWLEWHKAESRTKNIFAQSDLTICDQNKTEQPQEQKKTAMRSAVGSAQRQDEALSKLIQRVERGKVPTPQELQGLLRLAWQLNKQFKSLQLAMEFSPVVCNWRQGSGITTNSTSLIVIRDLSACH